MKCQEEAGGPAAGDVVVGWINTATGQVLTDGAGNDNYFTIFFQGGLDDYFLSGSQTCSDGAESCPDTTKVTKLSYPPSTQLSLTREERRMWKC